MRRKQQTSSTRCCLSTPPFGDVLSSTIESAAEAPLAASEGTKRLGTSQRGGLSRERSRVDPAIVASTILAFVVASVHLGTKSLWLDEAASAARARLGLDGLWKIVSGGDPNMGLYYTLLHFWVRIFGYSEASLRSLSVIAGSLTVPVTVLLGRRLFGRRAGLIAGLLLALSPFFVQYEQTARSYALVVLLVTLSSYFFVAELERPAHGMRVGYVLASVLAVYAHYFAVYVLLMQLLTLFAVKRGAALTRQWLTLAAAVGVLCAPELVFAARSGTTGTSWIDAPGLSNLVHLPATLGGGNILSKALIIVACYGVLYGLADRGRWRAGFVAAWCVGPVLLDYAESILAHPLFIDYYLIVVLPAFLLLAAAGLAKLPGRATGMAVVGVLVVLSGMGISDWYNQPGAENYRTATRYIVRHRGPDDGIIYYPRFVATGTAYYEARAGADGPRVIGFQFGQSPAVRQPRIWLVIRNSDVPARRRSQVEQLMATAYERVRTKRGFNGLTVILYGAPRHAPPVRPKRPRPDRFVSREPNDRRHGAPSSTMERRTSRGKKAGEAGIATDNAFEHAGCQRIPGKPTGLFVRETTGVKHCGVAIRRKLLIQRPNANVAPRLGPLRMHERGKIAECMGQATRERVAIGQEAMGDIAALAQEVHVQTRVPRRPDQRGEHVLFANKMQRPLEPRKQLRRHVPFRAKQAPPVGE
jgi:mannosyltransferase